MSECCRTLLVCIVCAVLHGCLPDTVDKSPETGPGIKRLSPDKFPALPENIAALLETEGYTIPQCYLFNEPNNAVRGEFTRRGQEDWAVLCSRQGVSSILVFRGASSEDLDRLAQEPDEHFLQSFNADGRMGFSRLVDSIDKKRILYYHTASGGPEPPPLDHDGIQDAFAGKGSTIHYCHEGKWLELSGAD